MPAAGRASQLQAALRGLQVGLRHSLWDRFQGVLLLLYGFLYMTLQAETYALLAGALGLWATLAIIMFLTRRIDWYAMSETTPRRSPDEKQEALDL